MCRTKSKKRETEKSPMMTMINRAEYCIIHPALSGERWDGRGDGAREGEIKSR